MKDSRLDSMGTNRCMSVARRCARPRTTAPMVIRLRVLPTIPPRPETVTTIQIEARTSMISKTRFTVAMDCLLTFVIGRLSIRAVQAGLRYQEIVLPFDHQLPSFAYARRLPRSR